MIIMSKKQLQKFYGKKQICCENTMVKWRFLTIIKNIPGKLTFIEHL